MAQSAPRGMLDAKALRQMVERGEIETVLAVFPDMYGRLMGKRCVGRFFVESVLKHDLHACDYLLASDMEMTPVPGYKFTSWEQGYGDFRLRPDLNTLRMASWLEKTAIILCDVYGEERDELVPFAPRTIMRKQVERAERTGYQVHGASELEFFLFNDSFETAARKQYINLRPIGNYIEDYHIFQGTKEEEVVGTIRSHLERSGIPVESSKGEWGPGQQEINLRFADLLEMADRHVIYKHAAKEIAWQKGKSITFMAKWNAAHAGSSMHIHVSLWDKRGVRPLFTGREKLGPLQVSKQFQWFLGGWMKHLRELFPFYAPYPTSYKRYVAGSFAPTAIAWSYDNRTAGFRIVGEGSSLRIECRTPGADANPYLAFAATLAAGLDGIENKLDPPPMFEGDVYRAGALPPTTGAIGQVPRTLNEAIAEMEQSRWVRKIFGDDVIDHYLHFFRVEQQKFDEAVTTWELARYFERA
ncbi:MAG: glutamine synthetase family protein [Bacteroidota bacterium]